MGHGVIVVFPNFEQASWRLSTSNTVASFSLHYSIWFRGGLIYFYGLGNRRPLSHWLYSVDSVHKWWFKFRESVQYGMHLIPTARTMHISIPRAKVCIN